MRIVDIYHSASVAAVDGEDAVRERLEKLRGRRWLRRSLQLAWVLVAAAVGLACAPDSSVTRGELALEFSLIAVLPVVLIWVIGLDDRTPRAILELAAEMLRERDETAPQLYEHRDKPAEKAEKEYLTRDRTADGEWLH